MSSALTGNKIKDSYQALLKMGTNGSLDPVTPIAISDGLGNDTPLLLSGIEFKTQVVSAAKLYGIWADLSSNSHLAIGDYAGQYNGTILYVNDSARLIQTYGGGSKGFKLDFTNSLYQFGDYDYAVNGTILSIDDNVRTIITNNGSGTQGLFMDFDNDDYQFGDINGGTAYLSIGINNSSLFGENVASLETANKQVITNNGVDRYIITGDISGLKGFNLDFANNLYQFGDYNGINFYGQLIITNGASELVSDNNNLGLFGPSLNTVLGYFPGSINTNNPAANSNNYVFGSDWLIDNSDDAKYPSKYNTVLNCYGGSLDTSNKAMKYNFFANISDSSFSIPSDISLGDNEILSNAFVFGLNNYIGNNILDTYIADSNSSFPPTNVVVLNGSALEYNKRTNNVFSVNTSEVITPDDTSGLVILGGDYYDKDSQSYITANHSFDTTNNIPYGISIQGNKALVKNTFTRVVANSFEGNSTVNGKVQIEEKQVYRYIDDGTALQSLLDSRGDSKIWLQSSASYYVEMKIVSVSTAAVATSGFGNWVRYIGGLICVDALGSLTIDEKTIAQYGQINDMDYNIDIGNNNCFIINIKPDTYNGNGAWVKADVKISCVTTG